MTTTSSATTRTTAPSLRQSISRISDADDGNTSSEADISRISRSRGASSSRGGGGGYGTHSTRPPPTTTPTATPGRRTGSTETPTSLKSVFRAFLGSAARGISLSEMTPTRSPASQSRQERSSLRPSPPKPEKRRRRGPGHSA